MTRSKLIKVLIGKSIVETILVATIAVGFYINAFPPYFHGWGESTPSGIVGWAVNNAAPWDRVSVQLFVDGNFVGAQLANLSRPDVSAAGWARDAWHGYVFNLPSLPHGRHEARIYALHDSGDGKRKSLQLLGEPLTFTISDGQAVKSTENK